MSDINDSKQQRLFFALWPSPQVIGQLRKALTKPLQHVTGKPVAPERWHLTLAFIGSVDATLRVCLEAAADSVQGTPFELELRALGYWKRPRVIWLAPLSCPPELQQLVTELRQALQVCGYEPESRPYMPHMTLMRKARREPRQKEIKPLSWPVERFVLVHSKTQAEGVTYDVVREWPMRASAHHLETQK